MAKKIKLTRPELKRHRDALTRFRRYLPMLKLKQQQLQMTLREVSKQRLDVLKKADEAKARIEPYRPVFSDLSGVNVRELAKPAEIKTTQSNVAGVRIPVFHDVVFAAAVYSLFATPAWVDQALEDQRGLSRLLAQAEILQRQFDLLDAELTKIIQRVNLFEKVKIPESQEAIRVIRIKLGDEMTAAVGRSKIAKAKIAESEDFQGRDNDDEDTHQDTPEAPLP